MMLSRASNIAIFVTMWEPVDEALVKMNSLTTAYSAKYIWVQFFKVSFK